MNFRIADYIPNSLENGEGVRDVIFFSGCKHKCRGCHNKEAQKMDFGSDISVDEIVLKVLKNKPMIDGVTISGGDPFFQYPALLELCKRLKEHKINIWVYTGYYYPELGAWGYGEALKYIDVLVDGRFMMKKKDSSLRYRGSSNQSIIHFDCGKINSNKTIWGE